MPFANTLGFYALLSLIPFILMYLIRPKPIEKIIPSLMFFIKEQKKSKRHAFFRRLVQNLLFYLQLAILLALAFTVAEPFLNLPHNETATNTIIVIDASASMQTKSGDSTRFEKALSIAANHLSGKVSIILAADTPEIVLEHGSNKEGKGILASVKPKDTGTNIESAMFAAESILGDEKGKIVVISDFVATDELDQPIKAERILAAKGNLVQLVSVGGMGENIGIVDMKVERKETTITIKNTNKEKASVKVTARKKGEIIGTKSVEILPGSIEYVVFKTPNGEASIEIDAVDNLAVDNKVYIATPERGKVKVLLITNERNSYLQNALSATDTVELEIRNPPIIKAYDINHDIIIISNIDEVIIPPDVRDIRHAIENGTSLIITAQTNLKDRNINELVPVRILDKSDRTSVTIDVINEITKNVEIGEVKEHLVAQALNNTVALATASDQSPMLAYQSSKGGTIFYYGIIDNQADFPKTHFYPIFWDNLIGVLTQKEDVAGLNRRIGDAGFIEFAKQGIYEKAGKRVALNLLNEKESEVSSEYDIFTKHKDFKIKTNITRENYDLVVPLLIFGLVLIFLEILYIKWRGDL